MLMPSGHVNPLRRQSLSLSLMAVATIGTLVFFIVQLWALAIVTTTTTTTNHNLRPSSKQMRNRPETLLFSPACIPHHKVATAIRNSTGEITWSKSLPFTRIYFYHVRKAGGTMLRKYLKKVAQTHNIHLQIQENKYAREVVGSHPGTMYVTNMRDPVSRSISHFKYEGRWDCRQMIKNATHYIPTLENAQQFEKWVHTGGFTPSPCDESFSFHFCAVNCYIQSYSGQGCTNDDWHTQYISAQERLFRYNLVFVYERFKDPQYARAIEQFFGVEGFNQESNYWCGPEAKQANEKMPLEVKFASVMRLTKLNAMDNKFFKEATSCWDEEDVPDYSFPRATRDTFASQANREVIGDAY